jgi:hypothetical protein
LHPLSGNSHWEILEKDGETKGNHLGMHIPSPQAAHPKAKVQACKLWESVYGFYLKGPPKAYLLKSWLPADGIF